MAQIIEKIKLIKTRQSGLLNVDFKNLKFGETFSDHMFSVEYKDGKWTNPEIKPFGNFEVSPATSVFHYGQAVFEGMKAFHYKDGKVNIFRPDEHYKRFIRSCERMDIPPIDESLFLEGLYKLVELDREWVPTDKFKSLYIRPFVIATDNYIGIRTAQSYRFFIITSPVGNYYKEGIRPVSLTTMPEFVRAAEGGVGEVKVPGNYAASLYPTRIAKEKGYTQVLWLDGQEKKYIEEVGTMNIFFVMNDTLLTPALHGSILSGITRKTVISLAKQLGIPFEERRISIDELIDSYKMGKFQEAFGTGTAAVVSPVGMIHHMGTKIFLNQNEMGPVAQKMYDTITSIHHGGENDPDNWCHLI